MDKYEVTEQLLLDMLGLVLAEIRSRDEAHYAKTMADVFHNVPSRLAAKMPAEEIFNDIMRVAKRHNLENII